MKKKQDAKLVLANGEVLKGMWFGYPKKTIAEIIFNTSITGYQEVLTDPSYKKQIVVMTFPEQGIYGINKHDYESQKIQVAGFVVSELINTYSNYQANRNLANFLYEHKISGIFGIDTRYLTILLRDVGVLLGAIVNIDEDEQPIIKKLNNMILKEHVNSVIDYKNFQYINVDKKNKKQKVLIYYDFGTKDNIVNNFIKYKYQIIKVPYDTKYEKIKNIKHNAVFFSNGPGNPIELQPIICEIKKMIENNEKLIGICLGHQLLALALNCKIIRLKFGHHGTNHPVKHLASKKVLITSQNHNYTIDKNSIKNSNIEITFASLNDSSIEGIKTDNILAVQFHPEAAPGPSDANYIFEIFDSFIQ